MKKVTYSGTCEGIGLSRVIRDCDFAEPISYFKNEYQLYYILEGERFFYSSSISFEMLKGTITFVDKYKIPYTNIIGGQFHDRILVEIKEQWLIQASELLEFDLRKFFEEKHGVLELTWEEQEYIEAKLDRMEEALKGNQKGGPAAAKNCLLSILLYIMEGAGKRPREFHMPKGKTMRYVKVREIIHYITEHYTEVSGLDELAAIFYLDKSYLSRIFKEVTNFTVNEFINSQRIGHARNLLLDPGVPILEISRQLGYESLSYFDRVFKKYVGISPLQYRKSKLET